MKHEEQLFSFKRLPRFLLSTHLQKVFAFLRFVGIEWCSVLATLFPEFATWWSISAPLININQFSKGLFAFLTLVGIEWCSVLVTLFLEFAMHWSISAVA